CHARECETCRRRMAAAKEALSTGALPPRPPAPDPLRTGPASGTASELQPSAPLTRGATLGRYVILYPVGSGGMGVVYAAYDQELDRKVALKLLSTGESAGAPAGARLVREAQ